MIATKSTFRSLSMAAASAFAMMGASTTANAQAQPASFEAPRVQFNIPAQSLSTALTEFSRQAHVSVVASSATVNGRQASPVVGEMSPDQALDLLIAGSGLRVRRASDGGLSLIAEQETSPTRLGAADQAAPRSDDEIVVTATRREERLEDVPQSIQAISGDELTRNGAVNFADYGRTVAGVSFIDDGPGRSQIFIRGVSSGGDIDTGKDSVVGMYFDETPVSESSSQPDLRLYDINHVEVLRGPQGTLYGSGSLGGTVRVLTNQPDFEDVAGYVQVLGSATNYGGANTAANGWLNVPLSDRAAVRAVGYMLHNSGFIDNGLNGEKDMGDEDTYGGRLALRMQPTEPLNITLTGYYQHTDIDSYNRFSDHYPALVHDQSAPEPLEDELGIVNLNVDLDLGFATLTSSTSYFDRSRYLQNDIDAVLGGILGPAFYISELSYDATTVSQEVRLASNADGRFRWLVGAFYMDRKDEFGQPINFVGAPLPASPADYIYNASTNLETTQAAVFAEANFDILSNLTATAGVRVSEVSRDMTSIRTGLFFGGAELRADGTGEERSTTPKFNLSYRPNDDSLIYVQAVQGFRVGGINVLPPCLGCTPIPDSFDSDTLWNYELGGRVALFDGALSLSGAVFRIDWEGIQLNIGREDQFNGIVNLGDARSQGAEFEFHGRVNEHLTYGGQVTYTDATLLTVDPTYAALASPGTDLPQVPEWSAAANAEWGTMLAGGDTWFYVRGDVQYVGERRSGLEAGSLPADSYTLLNARIGWDVGPLSVALFAMNATDERATLNHTVSAPGLLPSGPVVFDRYSINTPRTIGVSLARTF